MAEIIKPRDLNPGFLKNIESKYGEIDMVNDFFKPDLTTYYKATSINAEGSVTHKIIRLPSFGKLFSDLGKARNAASNLATNPDLRNDMNFQSQANDISNTFNSFRTFFRTNYPDQYQTVKNTLKEYAFGKASLTPYIKMGYTPVNQKELRKKSKGIDYVDLHKK